MKRSTFLGLALLCSFSAAAQGSYSASDNNVQIQNKKGLDIMPVKGEFAIGINALPALIYIGDLFGSGSSNNALASNKFVSVFGNNTLFGKYMVTDNQAIRAHVRVSLRNNLYRNELDDDGQVDPNFMLTDSYQASSSIYNVGAGYEWRRGKSRLRGIYGGEVFYQHSTPFTQTYKYGNPMQPGNEYPNSTSWSLNGQVNSEFFTSDRVLSVEGGKYNGVGLRAFAGVEYFVAPKICIGTEFGWGGSYGVTGTQTSTFETWQFGGAEEGRQERTTIDSGGSRFSIDNDNFNGTFYLMFYF